MKDEIEEKADQITSELQNIFSDHSLSEEQKRDKATVLILGCWTK